MKKLLLLMVFCSLYSNAQKNSSEASQIGVDKLLKISNTNLYISKKENLFGLVAGNNEIVFKPKFIYYEFYDENKFVKFKTKDEKYTLYNLLQRKILQENKQWISEFHSLKLLKGSQNFFFITDLKSSAHFLYNEKNEFVKNLKDYYISLHGGENYGVFILVNSNSDNFIIMNDKGNEIYSSPYIYQPYSNKDYFLVKSKNLNKYGIINHLGKSLIKKEFDTIYFKENNIFLMKENYLSLMNLNLKLKSSFQSVQKIDFITEKLTLLQISNNKWKLVNEEGKTKFQIVANKVEYLEKDRLKVTDSSNSYYIDENGNKIQ